MHTLPRLRMVDYFGIEAVSAIACSQLLFCFAFWTKKRFGFTDADNLLLYAVHGLAYIFSAKYGGQLADRMGPERLLALCLAGMAGVTLLGWLPAWTWRGAPFVVMALYT